MTTSVLVFGWPDASWAELGQMMLPDLTLIEVVPACVTGTLIDPSCG